MQFGAEDSHAAAGEALNSNETSTASQDALEQELRKLEIKYKLQHMDHIDINVVQATRKLAFSIATEGVGEKEQAHGCLFIVGDAALLCSEKENFGRVGLPHNNFSKTPWGKDAPRYNVIYFTSSEEDPSSSILFLSKNKRGIKSLCKEDAGIVIDGKTGDIWCGNFTVNDLSRGNAYGGTKGKAASSIAEQAGGCFVIKLSDEYCGSVNKPLPSNAEIEVYPCTKTCIKEPIPLSGGRDGSNQTDDELLKLKQVLRPLHSEGQFQAEDKMKSYVAGTREWAMKLFDDWLKLECKKKHKVLVLSAMAGLGKTTIAAKILTERHHIVAAHHFCLHNDSRNRDPKVMLLSIAYQIAEKIPKYREKLYLLINEQQLTNDFLLGREYNLMALFNQFLKVPLNRIPEPDRQYVILIDALDECDDDGKNDILDCIQKYFLNLPSWLRLFVTTRPEVPIMEKLVKFEPELIEPTEHKGNLLDLHNFFGNLLFSSEDRDCANDVIDKLIEKSEGLFIYAVLLVETIRVEESGIKEMLEQLPSGIDEFYEEQFRRIFDPDKNLNWEDSLGWKFVGLIVTAVEPLHFKVLQRLTESTDNESKIAIKSLSRFFSQGADEKLHIYHKSLVDWLTGDDNNTEFRIRIEKQQKVFAKRCWNLLNTCMIPGSTDIKQCHLQKYDNVVMDYILQHGVTHLCLAGMKEEGRKLVLDVGWLMARAQRLESCNNVIDDFEKLSKDDKLVGLVQRAVGLAMNALRKDYRQLPAQLIGRLGGGSTQGANSESESNTNHVDGRYKCFECLLKGIRLYKKPLRENQGYLEVQTNRNDDLQSHIQTLRKYNFGYKWWCPVNACWDQADNPCVSILEGHTSSVFSIAWSPYCQQLASGSGDKTIRIWDTKTGECERTLKGHTDFVVCIAWSPDAQQLASGSDDKTIRFWDTKTGECERTLNGHTDSVKSIAWSPDGQQLASGSGDKTIRIWDIKTGECERTLKGHTSVLKTIAWSPDGQQLASGSDDKIIRIWDTKTGECERTLKGHTAYVVCIAWSPDGQQLASGSHDQTIRSWDTKTGECERTLKGHTAYVFSIAWSPDGQQLASGSVDETIRIWDTKTGECERTLKGHSDFVVCIAWSSDGQQLASGSVDETIRIWDTKTGECERTLKGHSDSVKSIAWSPDGQQLASGSDDKTIRIWDTKTGECERTLNGHIDSVESIAWSPDGQQLASGSRDKTIRIWDTKTAEYERTLKGHTSFVESIAWSSDGRQLASGSVDETIRIWYIKTGECEMTLKGHTSFVESIAWSSDGQQLASKSWDNTIRVWNIFSNQCIKECNANANPFPPENFEYIPGATVFLGGNESVIDSNSTVAIDCENVTINGDTACGIHSDDKTISFFKLIK